MLFGQKFPKTAISRNIYFVKLLRHFHTHSNSKVYVNQVFYFFIESYKNVFYFSTIYFQFQGTILFLNILRRFYIQAKLELKV